MAQFNISQVMILCWTYVQYIKSCERPREVFMSRDVFTKTSQMSSLQNPQSIKKNWSLFMQGVLIHGRSSTINHQPAINQPSTTLTRLALRTPSQGLATQAQGPGHGLKLKRWNWAATNGAASFHGTALIYLLVGIKSLILTWNCGGISCHLCRHGNLCKDT